MYFLDREKLAHATFLFKVHPHVGIYHLVYALPLVSAPLGLRAPLVGFIMISTGHVDYPFSAVILYDRAFT